MTSFRLSNTMSVDIRYLWERSTSGPYWFKRKVPKGLVSLVGKTWVQFSLGTRDLKAAARLIAKHASEQDRHWAELAAPTRNGSIEQGRLLLQQYGINPVDPQADRFALELFIDAVESQLPDSVRRELDELENHGHPITPKDIAKRLPPAMAAAFMMAREGLEHLASDCMREYIEARTDDAQSVMSATLPFDYLIKLVGDRPLCSYRRADVRLYVEHLSAGKHSPTGKPIATSTIERYITSLRAAFARSIKEHELRIENIWAGTIEYPKGAKKATKRESFSTADYEALFAAIGDVASTDAPRCILVLLAETGARLAEIVGLRRVDCHVKAAIPYIHIVAHASRSIKTAHSERKVPLTPRALQALQRALKLSQDGTYVFPQYTSDQGCKATHASNTLNGWLKVRKIAPTAHGMRHGMRDLLRAVEAPQDVVEQLQGWGKVSQSSKYGAGHSLERLLEWVTRAVSGGLESVQEG